MKNKPVFFGVKYYNLLFENSVVLTEWHMKSLVLIWGGDFFCIQTHNATAMQYVIYSNVMKLKMYVNIIYWLYKVLQFKFQNMYPKTVL